MLCFVSSFSSWELRMSSSCLWCGVGQLLSCLFVQIVSICCGCTHSWGKWAAHTFSFFKIAKLVVEEFLSCGTVSDGYCQNNTGKGLCWRLSHITLCWRPAKQTFAVFYFFSYFCNPEVFCEKKTIWYFTGNYITPPRDKTWPLFLLC